MSDRVTITTADGIADVRLNRPDKRNALDPAMFRALVEAGEALRADPSVRVVVLSGEGPSFCAGLDLAAMGEMAGRGDAGDGGDAAGASAVVAVDEGRITHLGQQACFTWWEQPVPVIAAVHGHALGGGLQVALGCDLRVVHPEAKLSMREVYWGLVPDMTGTQFLPLLVGHDRALELIATARIIDGAEAGRIGLATHVSEQPFDDAMALAREIAQRSPAAVRAAKRLVRLAGRVPLAEGFAAERREIAALIGGPEQVEAVTAHFERRPPVFGAPGAAGA